ncbi:DNA-binding protein [Bradyrhizobium sp. Leo121]|uniref:DNA-binding protein n=1 Tax=Bradyrhizobium sp. Leo121 TaxID=1571195 RepID=UPI0010292B2D|nr:DNA-binding protein [Bradyrhizobium sp. Leo121]RZN33512.1 DNA-binding protein [Bradyrhizobium sp. Leo121]
MSGPVFLTLEEVVERYRAQVSEGTLRNWRSMRIGPSFMKIGKATLYPLEELDRWDRRNLVVCRPSRLLLWRKRRGEMCRIRQLALSDTSRDRY